MTLRITSPSNPRVKRVMQLRKPRERRSSGLLLAEGEREISRAVAAGLAVVELWVCGAASSGTGTGHNIQRLCTERTQVIETDAKVFAKLTYLEASEGVLAVVEQPQWTMETLPASHGEALVLVAVGTEKPGNLGAMVRSADAAGCDFVLAPDGDTAGGGSVDVFNPNAIRASTGAIFTIPTVACTDSQAIAFLQQRGFRIIATTPDGGTPYTATDLTGPTAIVIGPEDTGLSAAWLAAAQARALIPSRARIVDSLNASVAAGIILFEAVRQRAGA